MMHFFLSMTGPQVSVHYCSIVSKAVTA